jgi:hypothetical protein
MLPGISRSVGTLLDLRLEDNSFRIEAIGEVRVAYPGLGMGISFTRISDEDRERLREIGALDLAAFRDSRLSNRDASCARNAVKYYFGHKSHRRLASYGESFRGPPHDGREEFLQILRKDP